MMSQDALVYGYSNKSLGVILIQCSVSRIVVIGSPIGPMMHLATGFLAPLTMPTIGSTLLIGHQLQSGWLLLEPSFSISLVCMSCQPVKACNICSQMRLMIVSPVGQA